MSDVQTDLDAIVVGAGFGGLTLGYFPDPRTYGATFGVKF